MKETVYNVENKKVGEVDLPDEIFGSPANTALLYEAVKMQMANRRQGDAASKNRKLVSGSTKKIYRQKGTGRARHSDRQANIFVGGGKSFGPHPRDYSYSMPVKAKRAAILSALAVKHKDGKFIVVDNLSVKAPKTSEMVKTLKNLSVNTGLLVTDAIDENLRRAVRNIANVKLVRCEALNLHDILKHEHLVITQSALTKVQETLRP
jgi:large subunit ribosomal protein L4